MSTRTVCTTTWRTGRCLLRTRSSREYAKFRKAITLWSSPTAPCTRPPTGDCPHSRTARKVTPREAVRLVDEALTASVRDALVADVPVGAYLSGGVDSSLITALAAQERQGAGLHTFSAGFGDDRFDETSWARTVAGIVGSTHHEVLVTADDFQQNWSRLSWHRDAPAVRARRRRGLSSRSTRPPAGEGRTFR